MTDVDDSRSNAYQTYIRQAINNQVATNNSTDVCLNQRRPIIPYGNISSETMESRIIKEKVKDHVVGLVWGAFDGMCTGILIAVNISGAGWWIVGGVSQLVASFIGAGVGLFSGGAAGIVIGNKATKEILKEYREAFCAYATERNGTR